MKVSVIIPCYNVENYIEDCIDSVALQNYKNLEIICVDNNSSDDTLEKLRYLKKRYDMDFMLYSEQKNGAPAARNKGLKYSLGEYVQFLDADDLLTSQKIKRQIEIISNLNKKPDVIVGNYIQHDLESDNKYRKKARKDDIWKALTFSNVGITSSNLWRKEKIVEIGGWDESVKSGQDTRLFFELLKREAVIEFSDSFDTIRRVRAENSISCTNEEENWERYLEFRLEILSHLKKKKTVYYKNNRNELLHAVFIPIRHLYKFNPEKSKKFYKKYLKNFHLKRNESISWKYKFVYDMLGYSWAQKLKNLI